MSNSSLSFHTQLSCIMETAARSALTQACLLVDEHSAGLRAELSGLLLANAALTEQVHSLQCELTVVRRDSPKLRKSCRTVGAQTTGESRDSPGSVTGLPIVGGIFGNLMDLWKSSNPYSVETVSHSTQSSDQPVVPLSHQIITVTEIKEEECEEIKEEDDEEGVSTCARETLNTEVEHERLAQEAEEQSVEFSADDSRLSFDPEDDQVLSAGGLGEPSMQPISITDAEEAYSTHIIPIEEEELEEDVQFIQESQKEPSMTAAGEPSQNEQQTLPIDFENNNAPDRDTCDSFNILHVQTTSGTNEDKFTCEICGGVFFHKGTLTRHMATHSSNICQICKQHLPHKSKTHTCVPVSPFHSQRIRNTCKVCRKSFGGPAALKMHYLVHTGEKPFSCEFCGKRFTQKGNLKCHLRIHTGERPFYCGKCGETFTQKVNLTHHLMAHRNREGGAVNTKR